VNAWGDITVDQKNGIVFLPTGSPTYDFYGGDRPGDNLFGDCILALDARTGKLIWYFQTVHHDLLDYDNTAAPQLLTVTVDGKRRDIVAFAGKIGFLYVFDRLTGKPVWPIEERPAPQSDVPGEKSSPTQPFPTKPPAFAVQKFTADDLNPLLSAEDKTRFAKMIKEARNDGVFTPPALERYMVNMPGHSGGAGLFAPSSDPLAGEMFVVAMNAPAFLKLVPDPNDIADNAYHGPTVSFWNGCESVCSDDTDDMPAKQTALKARAKIAPALRAKGRGIFAANCQVCHGAELQGGGDAPSLLNVTQRRRENEIRGILQNGEGEMPSFAQLSGDSVTTLIAYLSDPGIAPTDVSNSSVGTPYPPDVFIPNGGKRYFTGWGFAPAIIKPPFSTLTAYDLNKGIIKWQIPYGNAVGYPPKDNNFGNLQYHGPKASPSVTATGLLISAMMDDKLRVWDEETGALIWSKDLPDRAAGIPAIYELDGREYVTVSVRGQYMAFALPSTSSKAY
jgi:quinoprotein glucose dehydrogenase